MNKRGTDWACSNDIDYQNFFYSIIHSLLFIQIMNRWVLDWKHFSSKFNERISVLIFKFRFFGGGLVPVQIIMLQILSFEKKFVCIFWESMVWISFIHCMQTFRKYISFFIFFYFICSHFLLQNQNYANEKKKRKKRDLISTDLQFTTQRNEGKKIEKEWMVLKAISQLLFSIRCIHHTKWIWRWERRIIAKKIYVLSSLSIVCEIFIRLFDVKNCSSVYKWKISFKYRQPQILDGFLFRLAPFIIFALCNQRKREK